MSPSEEPGLPERRQSHLGQSLRSPLQDGAKCFPFNQSSSEVSPSSSVFYHCEPEASSFLLSSTLLGAKE